MPNYMVERAGKPKADFLEKWISRYLLLTGRIETL